MKKSVLDWIVYVLVIIGAVNWGLVGIAGLDLVKLLQVDLLIKIVYILVGLAGLYLIYLVTKK